MSVQHKVVNQILKNIQLEETPNLCIGFSTDNDRLKQNLKDMQRSSAFLNAPYIYCGTPILEGEYYGKIISTYSQSSRNEE